MPNCTNYPASDLYIPFAAIQRVLVIKLRHHGDVLLSSPVFQVLQNHYPHLEIDALIYKDTQEMLALHPAITQIFHIDRRWKQQGKLAELKNEWQLFKRLQDRHYDLIIHLTESWRGAWLARLLKPQYAVVRRYQRRASNWWVNSFSHHYASPGGNRRHAVEIHLDVLRRLGLQPGKEESQLVLVIGDEAEKNLRDKLGAVDQPLIVIHPTSRWLFKCWDEKKVAELIDHLITKGHQIALTAAPDTRELAMVERINGMVTNSSPIINLAGQLSLKELAALIQHAALFIGVDSVPMHIAAAVQTPTVALFGPSGENEWGPWMNTAKVITTQYTCRPCGQDGCGNSKISQCLVEIPVDRVAQAADELLLDIPA